jgi:hypothetical protein
VTPRCDGRPRGPSARGSAPSGGLAIDRGARSPSETSKEPPPGDGSLREWVSIDDPSEERTWLFDVGFLLSSWECVYGRGCLGVLTEPAPELEHGCCSYGAHFTGEEDLRRVAKFASALTPEQWQFHGLARRRAGLPERSTRLPRRAFSRTTRNGSVVTRKVNGACIFLNRPEFPGGAGCALHRAALEAGEPPRQRKPDVCWQLPLRLEDRVGDNGRILTIVERWERRHWGPGGAEFAWWCVEAPEAHPGRRAAYETLADELEALVGRHVYRRLAAYLRARRAASPARAGTSERPAGVLVTLRRTAPRARFAPG